MKDLGFELLLENSIVHVPFELHPNMQSSIIDWQRENAAPRVQVEGRVEVRRLAPLLDWGPLVGAAIASPFVSSIASMLMLLQ